MSQSRPGVSAMNSSQTASREAWSKPAKPSRRAKAATISQSGRAAPGGGTTRSLKLTIRSLLVDVHSFSPNWAAGNSTSANWVVSVGW